MARKINRHPADFVYGGSGDFEIRAPILDPIELEKRVYKEKIAKQIAELSIEEKKGSKIDKKEEFSFLMKRKSNHRTLKFQYETGDVFPKEVDPPGPRFIQFPEPHVLITDLFDNPSEWYFMRQLISDFADEAFLTYELGFWLASISTAINCCEYILKYEYFRQLNKREKQKIHEEILKKLTLGAIITSYSDALGIKSKFFDKLNYLNDVRVSIFHFSPEREKRVQKTGKLEIEQHSSISDDMVIPITAFRVYGVMLELIDHFYSKEKALEYADECVADWLAKRNLKEEDIV